MQACSISYNNLKYYTYQFTKIVSSESINNPTYIAVSCFFLQELMIDDWVLKASEHTFVDNNY